MKTVHRDRAGRREKRALLNRVVSPGNHDVGGNVQLLQKEIQRQTRRQRINVRILATGQKNVFALLYRLENLLMGG